MSTARGGRKRHLEAKIDCSVLPRLAKKLRISRTRPSTSASAYGKRLRMFANARWAASRERACPLPLKAWKWLARKTGVPLNSASASRAARRSRSWNESRTRCRRRTLFGAAGAQHLQQSRVMATRPTGHSLKRLRLCLVDTDDHDVARPLMDDSAARVSATAFRRARTNRLDAGAPRAKIANGDGWPDEMRSLDHRPTKPPSRPPLGGAGAAPAGGRPRWGS